LQPPHRSPIALRASASLCAAQLCACTVAAPEREPLPLQDVAPFSAESKGSAPVARWWTAFEDLELETHLEAALAGSFTLEEAWQRVLAAEAIVQRTASVRRPFIDGRAGLARSDSEPGNSAREVSLGLSAGFEVDLWGRIADAVDAEELRSTATAQDLHAAAITLSADYTRAWYQLAHARLERELVESQIETNALVLEVLELRFAVGQSGSADVLRQRQLVEASREQLLVLDARAAVLEHLLATLAGRAPQDASFPADKLPTLPSKPAPGAPAELLQRRPDVTAAWLALAAADADVAVAAKARYPRIQVSAALTTFAEDPAELFNDWLAQLAADLVVPLIDGGDRAAEVERSVAVRRQLLAAYGNVVLAALAEVEDALALETAATARIASLRTQVELAVVTESRLRQQYLNGAADFLDMLSALRTEQALRRDLLSAQLDRVLQRIGLHRALAGGFELPQTARETADAAPPPDP